MVFDAMKMFSLFWGCTISSLSLPQTPFFRSLRCAICNPKSSHWMGMPWITNGGPKRARKRSVREREGRSCKHRIETKQRFPYRKNFFLGPRIYFRAGRNKKRFLVARKKILRQEKNVCFFFTFLENIFFLCVSGIISVGEGVNLPCFLGLTQGKGVW